MSFLENVKDLDNLREFLGDFPIHIGCTIYLVRKISGHLIECKLLAYSVGTVPQVELEWLKSYKYQYRINLSDNTVHALEATTKHKDEMKLWYNCYEPQRKLLIKLCEDNALKEKRRKKKL